jgi:hypothetical protein
MCLAVESLLTLNRWMPLYKKNKDAEGGVSSNSIILVEVVSSYHRVARHCCCCAALLLGSLLAKCVTSQLLLLRVLLLLQRVQRCGSIGFQNSICSNPPNQAPFCSVSVDCELTQV